jgi:NADH:ubiquinone oxidoreductase subunit 3 (subunit A)
MYRRFKPTVSSSSSSSSGIDFIGLLTILFVGLKLTNHITWPWIWVLSPIWISFLIFLVFVIAMLVGYWFLTKK